MKRDAQALNSALAQLDRGLLRRRRPTLETGDAAIGTSLVRDMNFAISFRNGKLLGHPARVSRGQVQMLAASAAGSAVQAALRRCLLPMVVRTIGSSEDFIHFYGHCITQDPALKVSEIRPAAGQALAVTLLFAFYAAALGTVQWRKSVRLSVTKTCRIIAALMLVFVLPERCDTFVKCRRKQGRRPSLSAVYQLTCTRFRRRRVG